MYLLTRRLAAFAPSGLVWLWACPLFVHRPTRVTPDGDFTDCRRIASLEHKPYRITPPKIQIARRVATMRHIIRYLALVKRYLCTSLVLVSTLSFAATPVTINSASINYT